MVSLLVDKMGLEVSLHVCSREQYRIFRDQTNPLDFLDDHWLVRYYRIDMHANFEICCKIDDELSVNNTDGRIQRIYLIANMFANM